MSPSSIITLIIEGMWARWEGSPYHIPVGLSFVCSQILNIGCKTFIQPQVIPPPQGHQITKPLKGQKKRCDCYAKEN